MKVTIDKKNSRLEFIGWYERNYFLILGSIDSLLPSLEEEWKMQSIFMERTKREREREREKPKILRGGGAKVR